MNIAPGAVRTTTLTIENPNQAPVEIHITAETPRGLQNMTMGDLLGQELSAADWTEIRPAQFTLRGNGRQNVRVVSRIPQQGVGHANYYADLVLLGRYADGQSAGSTHSTIHLANPSVTENLSLLIERLLISEGDEPSTYVVQTRMVNTGNVHAEPDLRVNMITGRGEVVATSRMSADVGPLLPLGVRDYSGEIDLRAIEAATYALRVTGTIDGWERVRKQVVVQVEPVAGESEQGGENFLVILDVDSDAALALNDELEAN